MGGVIDAWTSGLVLAVALAGAAFVEVIDWFRRR